MRFVWSLAVPLFAVFSGCVGDDSTIVDSGAPDSATSDSSKADTSTGDGSSNDGAVEAGPFDTASLVLWLDAPNVLTTNSKITTWTDKSGHGNDATQSDAAKQPVPATNVQNALPAVNFADQTGAMLQFSKTDGFDDFTKGLSLFIAAKPTAPFIQQYDPILFLGTDSSGTRNDAIEFLQMANAQTDGFSVRDSSGNVATTVNGGVANPNEFAIYEIVLSSSAVVLYKNGASINTAAGAPPAKVARTVSTIGGALGLVSNGYGSFVGLIGEMILFGTGLDDPHRKAVESYLKTKWNL
jgi:hypothetical protein